MIVIKDKTNCCGCGACAQACPKCCILLKSDEEGFSYPAIDADMCVNCGLCERVCPVAETSAPDDCLVFPTPIALGGWIKDEKIRYDSSSGGAFSLFALHILNQGGIVYGAAMDDQLVVRHIGVESAEELTKLRGSKYVQSVIGSAYKEIREHLDSGRKVLFVGTPCQAAGLRSYLAGTKKDKVYNNLYIVDFICHGVPSPLVFKSYLEYLASKYRDAIVSFKFRMKDRKWNPTGLQLGTGTGTGTGTGRFIRRFPGFMDFYMNIFLDDVALRPSCYKCAFKSLPKNYADITIADFWGVKSAYPELYDGKGTSLVLLHSSKGQALFEVAKDDFHYKTVEFEKAIRRNQSLIHSSSRNPGREKFFNAYQSKPFPKVLLIYGNPFAWGFHKALGIARKKIKK